MPKFRHRQNSLMAGMLLCSLFGLSPATGITAEFEAPPLARVGELPCVSAELIYPLQGRPTPECHASTIEETPTGLIAAWFGGTHERHVDVGIWVAHHDGESWSAPVEVVDGSEGEDQDYPCWNPVLFQPATGPLMLFYKVGPSPRSWWGLLMTSDDLGRTWSTPRRLGTDSKFGAINPNLIGPVKNKPIQLADGTILSPSSGEHNAWRVHIERSTDQGATWQVIGPLGGTFDAIQPSILTYADGGMQVLCRTRQGVIAQSRSQDRGETWSDLAATELPNPNSGTDAVTLQDGRQLLVYNHTVRTAAANGRQMLNVAISHDGESWSPILTLENEGNPDGYSYPAVIQTKDGKVHITYTWRRESVKHVVLDVSSQ